LDVGKKSFRIYLLVLFSVLAPKGTASALQKESPSQEVDAFPPISHLDGGLWVDVDCGDGDWLIAVGDLPGVLLHGLDQDPAHVGTARKRLQERGLYGKVSVDVWDGKTLPYGDGSVNFVFLKKDSKKAREEAQRVLAPLGWMVTGTRRGWEWNENPWPSDIDQWTHYLHGPDNNAVAQDSLVGPPRSLQWVASPRWARHHDRLASMSALVSANGKIFYIMDEGSRASIVLPARWHLVGRDAFSGVLLWKRSLLEWQTHLWPLKSGPAQLPRRLVACEDSVYVTLSVDGPVERLDASSGETVHIYEGTERTDEILASEGRLYLLQGAEINREKYRSERKVEQPWWTGEMSAIKAVEMENGQACWSRKSPVLPLTLAVAEGGVFFHDGGRILRWDAKTGEDDWASEPILRIDPVMSFFAPTLVVRQGVVLFAGGEESGLVKSTGGATKSDTLTALDADTGKLLWTAEHPPSGYSSPEDLFVIGDAVWYGGVSNGGLPGEFFGRRIDTGELEHSFKADVSTYWFHHRCYRGKATEKYIMVARTGTEFIDPSTGHWQIHHWVRGGCMYGVMPANGMLYTPPHACACYPESKLFGMNALKSQAEEWTDDVGQGGLEKGEIYDWGKQKREGEPSLDTRMDWPTFRHDVGRSGSCCTRIEGPLCEIWKRSLHPSLTAVTVADDLAFVAEKETHVLRAVRCSTGEIAWSFIAGGRIDSPPTVHEGRVIFGSADGWVTCLRARDGRQVWRFRAAPKDRRIVAFGQLESKWPVHGSVLVYGDQVYALAGRSLFLDGGMRLCILDLCSGELLGERILDDKDPGTGEDIHVHVKRLTMPVALPDVLSTDGRHLYMRSQVFDLKGDRLQIVPEGPERGVHASIQAGNTQHLFSSSGFLDDSWFHRAYWLFGRNFEGGWNSYYLAGKKAPAGKMLCFDEDTVYGYGRQPKYFKWTLPMEFHLFSSPKEVAAGSPGEERSREPSIIRLPNAEVLHPEGKPVTVSAWVKTKDSDGVILARGGDHHGYCLCIQDKAPCFGVRVDGQTGEVGANFPLQDEWTHLAGVLGEDGTLRIFVNGRLAAETEGIGLLSRNPAEAMQIGGEEGSVVLDGLNELGFAGAIDEVRVSYREWTETELQSVLHGAEETPESREGLVLHLPLDDGKASDVSGNRLRGEIQGTQRVKGVSKEALQFTGVLPDQDTEHPPFNWTVDTSILVRAMALGEDILWVAGPEDVLDEPKALAALKKEETEKEAKEGILEQMNAWCGVKGGVLRSVSAENGTTKWETSLDALPVWDGLTLARGSLFLACEDGTLRCFGEAESETRLVP